MAVVKRGERLCRGNEPREDQSQQGSSGYLQGERELAGTLEGKIFDENGAVIMYETVQVMRVPSIGSSHHRYALLQARA